MPDNATTYGRAHTDLSSERLHYDQTRHLLAACLDHPAFDVVELRELIDDNETVGAVDILVVDCADGTVPSNNEHGIKNRERLALEYCPSHEMPHQVRALRREFPDTLHQNAVLQGEPKSLCLYSRAWTEVEREWTPQRHLERILWWLRETATGTLHRADQPVEQLYYSARFEIVLPPDFIEQSKKPGNLLTLHRVSDTGKCMYIRGSFEKEPGETGTPFSCVLTAVVPQVTHGPLMRPPYTLGELHDQLAQRGSRLLPELNKAIGAATTEAGIEIPVEPGFSLLVVGVPLKREGTTATERVDFRGFCVSADLARLGIATGALADGKERKAYRDYSPSIAPQIPATGSLSDEWRRITVEPVEVSIPYTRREARRSSGVPDKGADDHCVLAGVGALGSALAEVWSRIGWRNWTYVDDDALRSHNVVRHAGKDCHIGLPKVSVVEQLTNLNYGPGDARETGVPGRITDLSSERINNAIRAASLVVDTTTTLDAPRELADRNETPRCVSAFLTPSGLGSVMLLEDATRSIRLSALEAQYYRAILRSEWGASHLVGPSGKIIVGGGCRDVSAVLSQELVQLHAATLARQIRKAVTESEASIRIWSLDDSSGTVSADSVTVSTPVSWASGDWTIVGNEFLIEDLRNRRSACLPSETGGVLLGYLDHKLRTIHLVDAIPAPPDSKADPSGFTRGVQGLRNTLEACSKRTAKAVGYVGEWHSHPLGASARPSNLDIDLLADLATQMSREGVPGLVLIVGERDVSVALGRLV